MIIGRGSPEGRIASEQVDTVYLDIDAGVFYYKQSSEQGTTYKTGWVAVDSLGGYGN